MKKLLLMAILMAYGHFAIGQTNPTLAVGLETLTMNKGTIDVKVLTEIIMEKQKELKQEALKRFMFKLFPDANYTTKFYVQNCLNILLNEKNPQVIEKEILELTTNYALALGTAYALVKTKDPIVMNVNVAYSRYKLSSVLHNESIIYEYEKIFKKKRRLLHLEMKKIETERVFNSLKNEAVDHNISKGNLKNIKTSRKKMNSYNNTIAKIKLRNNINEKDDAYVHAIKILKGLDLINVEALKKPNLSNLSAEQIKSIKKYAAESLDNITEMDIDELKESTIALKGKIKKGPKAFDYLEMIETDIQKMRDVNPLKTTDKTLVLENLKLSIQKELKAINSSLTSGTFESKNICINTDGIKKSLDEIVGKENDSIGKSLKSLITLLSNQIAKNACNIKDIGKNSAEKDTIMKNLVVINDSLKKLVRYRTKIEIPFGHILDVVSLSLTDMTELQKKGFFKNKIDYRNDAFYKNLDESIDGSEFKTKLDTFKMKVCDKINPYITYYDVIKEFINKNKSKNVSNIVKDIRNRSFQVIKPKLDDAAWVKANNLGAISIPLKSIKEQSKQINQIKKAAKEIKYSIAILDSLSSASNNNVKETSLRIKALYHDLNNSFNEIDNKTVQKLLKEVNEAKSKAAYKKDVMLEKLTITKRNEAIDTTALRDINKAMISTNKKIEAFLNKAEKDRTLDEYLDIHTETTHIEGLIKESQLEVTVNSYDITNCSCFEFKEEIKRGKEKITFLSSAFIDANNDAEAKKKELNKVMDANYEKIAESDETYKNFLRKLLEIVALNKDKKFVFDSKNLDTLTISKAAKVFPEIYNRVKDMLDNKEIKLMDVIFLEDYVSNKMIELKIRDKNNDDIYNKILENTEIIIPLLKIKVLQKIGAIGDYDEELINLFEFISNLNNLDRAQTYQSVVDMLRDGSKKVEENLSEGEFKNGYTLFINAMKKYTIINPKAEKEYVEVDVVSFLNDLQQYYGRNSTSRFGLYLTLGLNQNFLFNRLALPGSATKDTINSIGFASEKIGVKYRIHSVRQFKGYENAIKDDVYLNKKAPFVNEVYAILYGSGLLYTVANTATNKNFNFPHAGLGFGVRFYNALDLNLTLGIPFVKNSGFFEHTFYGFGLDIPLGEYLEKIGNKK